MSYVLLTDSTADLGYQFMEEHHLPFVPFCYIIDDNEYLDDMGKTIDSHHFYENMRNASAIPVTTQINVEEYKQFFAPFLNEGKDIVYVCFSSGLSGSYNSALKAAEEMRQLFLERKIEVIDSRAASLGQGLIVFDAIQKRDQGVSFNELVEHIRDRVPKTNHWFTVDDLNHLYRGGRVSKTAAVVGTVLSIKPVLHVDNEGHLIPVTKVRGRNKALQDLAEKVKKYIVNSEEQTLLVSHGDALDDVNYFIEEVKKRVSLKDIYVSDIGPVIGAHSGPGTVAVFFFGDSKTI